MVIIWLLLDSLENARRWEVFPLWAVSVLVSGPASPRESHPHAHGWETLHVWLLRAVIPTETAAASTHQPLPRPWLRSTCSSHQGQSALLLLFTIYLFIYIYLLLRHTAARHTVIQTRHSYTKIKKIKNTEILDSDHKFTDMAKEFQISSLIELLDSFGESTLYRLPTATKAWCIRRDNDIVDSSVGGEVRIYHFPLTRAVTISTRLVPMPSTSYYT